LNSIAKLIKARSISFNEMLIRYYTKLNLNETEAVVLMLLYGELESNESFLTPNAIKNKVSITEDELSKVIVNLLNKGFIEISGDLYKETYTLDPVIEKLGQVIEQSDTAINNEELDLKELVRYIETSYGRPLNSNDLILINFWLEKGYTKEEIKEAVLTSLRAKKMHLKYVDAILLNRHKEREKVDAVDDEMKQLLDTVYVKHR